MSLPSRADTFRHYVSMSLHQGTDRISALVAATFALASLILVLVLPSGTLLSASNTDMVSEFVSSRAYLADSLRHGYLPLWNPFTYGGQPFLGGFESGVLYPPNLRIRRQKLDYDFAAMFDFPPENFLTTIVPGFFGSLGTPVYRGRCYLWDMSLFIGAVAPLLIAIPLCDVPRKRRAVILDLVIAGLLLVLALGIHTPVFGLLYGFAPGFGLFRGWSSSFSQPPCSWYLSWQREPTSCWAGKKYHEPSPG